MDAVFADTSYYLALLNRGDAAHRSAIVESRVPRRRFVTTEYVLVELGAALAYPSGRSEFLAVCAALADDPTCETIPSSHDLFVRAKTLFAGRPDKHWSLTDCISFVVMADAGLTAALTGDRHFTQAGFRALLA